MDELCTRKNLHLKLHYTNWRGETSVRTITPEKVYYGSTEWHPESQWLLSAYDHDKQAIRDFALRGFGLSSERERELLEANNRYQQEARDARAALKLVVAQERSILADLRSAHSGRGPGASAEMRSDDRDDYTAAVAMFASAKSAITTPPAGRARYRVEHDGFEGVGIGSYETLEGKRGKVLQQTGSKVVHVYGEKWLVAIEGEEQADA